MKLEHRGIDELHRIALGGGGLVLSAKTFTVDDLHRLALAAGSSGAQLRLRDVDRFTADELHRIALGGKGRVQFET